MKKTWRVLCVFIFVFGAALLFHAQKGGADFQAANKPIDVSDTEPALAFVVEYVDSSVSSDGTVTVTGSTTRYVKADGEWRLVLRRHDGKTASAEAKVAAVYGGTPEGVFEKKSNSATRRYVSPSSISPSSDQSILQLYRSHNYLRAHPEFVRTDQVLGFNVYVHRSKIGDPANPEQWKETSYSPRTGLTELRSVLNLGDGLQIRREAISVEFKELSEDLNNDLKNLPITPKEKKTQNNQ